MSVNYASGLSPYEHKGKCGMKESFDDDEIVDEKILALTDMLKPDRHLVAITGAGISTSAGIPDFRGPKGVWTLEEKGQTPQVDVTFEGAKPTPTHMALVALEKAGYLKFVISQNVDGLHLRSGLPRNRLAELHGNMFVEQCDKCRTQYIGNHPVPTMALRPTGNYCTQVKAKGRCRGRLIDTILDWEDSLPCVDLSLAEHHCRTADVCLCLGTSLQILPCGKMPLLTKKKGGKIVIVNLQTTKQDKSAHLKINAYVDRVMIGLCSRLGVALPQWTRPIVVLKSEHKTTEIEKLPVAVVEETLLPSRNIADDVQQLNGTDRNEQNSQCQNSLVQTLPDSKTTVDALSGHEDQSKRDPDSVDQSVASQPAGEPRNAKCAKAAEDTQKTDIERVENSHCLDLNEEKQASAFEDTKHSHSVPFDTSKEDENVKEKAGREISECAMCSSDSNVNGAVDIPGEPPKKKVKLE